MTQSVNKSKQTQTFALVSFKAFGRQHTREGDILISSFSGGIYWPTCLLCCLVFKRTICRMLELVMSDTTSATRFHTRSRAPHNMWYWRSRIPCRHSWPSSIFLHFPFLTGRKVKVRHRFIPLYDFTCRAEFLFWNTADEERYTRLALLFLQD